MASRKPSVSPLSGHKALAEEEIVCSGCDLDLIGEVVEKVEPKRGGGGGNASTSRGLGWAAREVVKRLKAQREMERIQMERMEMERIQMERMEMERIQMERMQMENIQMMRILMERMQMERMQMEGGIQIGRILMEKSRIESDKQLAEMARRARKSALDSI